MEMFLHRDGQQLGPYSLSVLRSMYEQGELLATDLAWDAGSQNWLPVSEIFQQQSSSPPLMSPPQRPAPPLDSAFFDQGGIGVTKTRFVVGAQTFALAGITSVRGIELSPNRGAPLLLLIAGLCALQLSVFIGIPMMLGAIVWLSLPKPTFSVVLTTAGGEVKAYNSPDKHLISKVIDALTKVIIARG